MRLTKDLILCCEQYINPLGEFEVCLRGYQIPMIENMGVLEDGFDCVDLSDNSISLLANIPRMRRVVSLLLANNRIRKVSADEDFGKNLPNIENLILSNNRLEKLSEIKPLIKLNATLLRLSFVGNPVTKQRNYRLFVVAHFPKLKLLDFQKISDKERKEAIRIFGDSESSKFRKKSKRKRKRSLSPAASSSSAPISAMQQLETSMVQSSAIESETRGVGDVQMASKTTSIPPLPSVSASDLAAMRSVTPSPFSRSTSKPASLASPKTKPLPLTKPQIDAVTEAIMGAQTAEETDRLEQLLKSGVLPTATGGHWKRLLQPDATCDSQQMSDTTLVQETTATSTTVASDGAEDVEMK